MDQQKSIDEMEELHISRDRSRQPQSLTTDAENSGLRAILESLSWICGQTHFLQSVDVNFLITTIPVSTMSEILRVNQVVRAVKKWRDLKLKVHHFPEDLQLEMTCWTDAAWATRPLRKIARKGSLSGWLRKTSNKV